MNKIQKTLSCIIAASFLAFAPVKAYAQQCNITIKASEKLTKEITNYIVDLAVDIDDDGKSDRKGYETLFQKLGIEYDQHQSLEEFQKQIRNYITNIKTEQEYNKIVSIAYSELFTKKDMDMYIEKMFNDYLPRALEEIMPKMEKELDKIIEQLDKNKEKSN